MKMLENVVNAVNSLIKNKNLSKLSAKFLFSFLSLYLLKDYYESKIKRKIKGKFGEKENFSERVWEDMYGEVNSMIKSTSRIFRKGVSPKVVARIGSIMIPYIKEGTEMRKKLKEKYGYESTPAFVTISPTNVCNLKCKGCYAGENYDKYFLDFDAFDWIIKEMKEKFNVRFFVISGGEPFAYKNKTILDIFAKNLDSFFLVFTNGTLITKETANKLEDLANVTLAISIEGFKKETESRRGVGVFEKILEAMENLRDKKLFFGISMTPMRNNADLLFSDEFIKFWFDKKGATYGWYFQYMPIGLNPNPDFLVTPDQREKMWCKIWKYIKKGYFLVDFWNCGPVSRGCISAAKDGGYFHVLWNGDITPCVFIPFKDKDDSLNNVYNLINNGKSIVDAINTPFFKALREWQKEQQKNAKRKCNENNIENNTEKCYGCSGNLLMPCPIRDDSRRFYEIVKKTGAIPFDKGAERYLELIEEGIMPSYNDLCHSKLDKIWKNYYQ